MSKQSRQKSIKRKLMARFQRFSSSSNLQDCSEGLKFSIEQTTTVSAGGLVAKLDSLEFPDVTEAMLLANSKEFKPFIENFCNKSGKFLHNYSLERFSDMLAIHGKEKTLSLLIQLSSSNYAIEWLSTDSATLNKLMVQDSCGYFVFAANHFFQLLPPETKSQTDFSTVPCSYKESYLRLQDKITARENLEKLDPMMVLECNELIRRLLGLSKPTKAALMAFFTPGNLIEATKNPQALRIFIEDIKENLTFLLQKHFKSVRSKIIKQQADLYKITANDIEKIKQELAGMNCFHKQPSIRKQSKRTAVLLDLKDFIIDEYGESQDADLWNDLADFEVSKGEQALLNNFSLDGEFAGVKQIEREANAEPTPKAQRINLPIKKEKPANAPVCAFKLNI